jgi:hypothetical protein
MTNAGATATRFATKISRPQKRTLGRTEVSATPLHVRTTGPGLDGPMRGWLQARTGRQLGKFATHIDRVSLRFEDINGPRGGRDTVCRAKVVLSDLPSVVVEERGETPRAAFDRAIPVVSRAVRKAVGRGVGRVASRAARGMGARGKPGRASRSPGPAGRGASAGVEVSEGSLIGRRVGQGRDRLLRAADRPEKRRRDVPVDTALPGVSASDRKVGAGATARRNTKLNLAGMTAALEDSATGKPSRKNTRRSTNRAKSGAKLERRAKRELLAPQARARRAAARRRG